MTLFRSELLPFHPPRYRPRIGHGLQRYGRARAQGRYADAAEAPCANTAHIDIDIESSERPSSAADVPADIPRAA